MKDRVIKMLTSAKTTAVTLHVTEYADVGQRLY
jgi:hypothetical protein